MSPTLGSVDNALRILHLLRRKGPLRVSDIAKELHVGTSTAHRLLATLREQRFVRQEAPGKRYELGPAMLFTAGTSAVEHCVATAAPIMMRLRDAIKETVHLSALRGTEVVFLTSAEANRPARVTTRVGMHPIAHATAAGKVLLAALERDQFLELYPDERLEALTLRTVTSRRELEAQLLEVLETGYARNIGESEPEIYTIAVPIHRPHGGVIGALSISTWQDRAHPCLGSGISAVESSYLESIKKAQRLIESMLAF